ncbi:MAG TPA: NUDIX domain-containing protein [Candidatus Saccharimonadales bacterium]|nr:NUDIX domain-containing protein [Candidatus Saccharimonadales bacterium]
MEHAAHNVDILDETGSIVGHKLRREIDKLHDIFHVIMVFLITPEGEIVLTPILDRTDLPNLYPGQLSIPVGTIRRTDETAEAAARRSVARELFIDDADVKFVGEGPIDYGDKIKRYVSVFYVVGDPPKVFSKTDIGEMFTITPRELTKRLKASPKDFAPSLRITWERYLDKLPV